jgi:hypothetical protein
LVEESGVVMQTDNENKKLEEARNIIIDALGRVYALYGLPDVIGRIYGVLFLADRRLIWWLRQGLSWMSIKGKSLMTSTPF